jgi:hypothetical protein
MPKQGIQKLNLDDIALSVSTLYGADKCCESQRIHRVSRFKTFCVMKTIFVKPGLQTDDKKCLAKRLLWEAFS